MILHSHINDYQSWLLMGLIYLALNVFTMTIFLFRPFHWDHEPGIQRVVKLKNGDGMLARASDSRDMIPSLLPETESLAAKATISAQETTLGQYYL
ncbi:dol-p-glc:glc(2)man(9)glcnac(2)-pp-dol alpha-1 [Quercus suber]|uniref:Dol-p-glc:glc(2)man(9)glcnac(2)-pp-dol alpha-1 n=1 Tax=Quercus suber TaxID=58331 RepID=A0AAW0LKJ2_QUESU